MCGIAGYFGQNTIPRARIGRALATMERRGPDACSFKEFERTGGGTALLLHSRLSIIDLDPRSNQPFERDGHCIAFNGEIYNYVEMRRDLVAEGETFRTRSDTEVLLAAIARHGVMKAADQAEGMWAFAVYDEATGTLELSRDRFGEKPLYVHRADDGIYFASEPKAIFALLGRKLPVNDEHLLRYIVNGYKSLYKGKHTFFKGLEELSPATVLRIGQNGSVETASYWKPEFAPVYSMTRQQAVDGARDRLIEAMRLRLRSDVPLAFLLSGGIDSSVLTAIAKRNLGYDVHAFTIINEDERYDERDIVEQTVMELGIRHTPVPVTAADFLSQLRRLVSYHDAPVFTITYYVQWLLMQKVHEHGYKISVSGTGADELFSGYYDHHLMHLQAIQGTPLHTETLSAWTQHIKPLVRNPYLRNPNLFIEDVSFRDHIYLGADKFAEALAKPFAEVFAETRFCESLLRNRMLNEMFHEAVPVILHEDDLNAMYHSIENRSPFLDRSLFEFCYAIPDAHLIRDGFNKAILRDAGRGIAPNHVLDRRMKVGFNAPIQSFLDADDPKVCSALTEDGPLFSFVRRDVVVKLLEEMKARRTLPNSESKFLFNIVNTKLFLETAAA